MNSTGACFLFKKNDKGSRVRPWNNLFRWTEWIISRNEQLLARTAANTERSHSSIIQGSYGYQAHSLMYWVLTFFFFFALLLGVHPKGLDLLTILTQPRVVCISIKDKGLVTKNCHHNFSPLQGGHNATWHEVLFWGPGSRGGVCSVSPGSGSSSCPYNKSVC